MARQLHNSLCITQRREASISAHPHAHHSPARPSHTHTLIQPSLSHLHHLQMSSLSRVYYVPSSPSFNCLSCDYLPSTVYHDPSSTEFMSTLFLNCLPCVQLPFKLSSCSLSQIVTMYRREAVSYFSSILPCLSHPLPPLNACPPFPYLPSIPLTSLSCLPRLLPPLTVNKVPSLTITKSLPFCNCLPCSQPLSTVYHVLPSLL